jgi:pimeloyl-ACP methyl ester carboxylesterase
MWLILAVSLLLLFALVSLYFFRLAAVRTQKASFSDLMPSGEAFDNHQKALKQDRQWLLALPLESVSIKSHDGLTLRAKLFNPEGSRGIILLSHGYRSAALHDFPTVARFYVELGYGLLLIDQRACGQSDGRYIGFGAQERFDIARWAWYLYRRFPGAPICLDGISMGATAVLLSLALELPPTVCGAIADCGFTSPMEIMRHVQRRSYPMSGAWVVAGVRLLLRLIAHYDPAGCSTVDALKNARVPVLFVHGDSDKFVPIEMTLANHAACASPKQLLIVPGAGHGESYVLDRTGCEAALRTFLAQYCSACAAT